MTKMHLFLIKPGGNKPGAHDLPELFVRSDISIRTFWQAGDSLYVLTRNASELKAFCVGRNIDFEISGSGLIVAMSASTDEYKRVCASLKAQGHPVTLSFPMDGHLNIGKAWYLQVDDPDRAVPILRDQGCYLHDAIPPRTVADPQPVRLAGGW